MNNHKKKMIAPIVITVLVVAYYIMLFAMIIPEVESGIIKALLCIIPAVLGVAMVGVCIQRIREIKGGEEDDLSNY